MGEISKNEIMKMVDHTLLSIGASREEILRVCDEGLKYNTASVCIPPSYVKTAADYLQGRLPVCTVIGFPNGYNITKIKAAEAAAAIEDGAEEIDMVINNGWVKNRQFKDIEKEIDELRKATEGKILKVIVETCLLTEEEKIKMCEIVTDSGADFIKTSTGFAGGGATFEDVQLFAKHVGPNVMIKAAGGISSFNDAERFIELGAKRLGTSRLVKILKLAEEF